MASCDLSGWTVDRASPGGGVAPMLKFRRDVNNHGPDIGAAEQTSDIVIPRGQSNAMRRFGVPRLRARTSACPIACPARTLNGAKHRYRRVPPPAVAVRLP